METLSPGLQQALIFLVYTSVVLLVTVTVFLVKFLIDASTLLVSLNELSVILKKELEPVLKELQKALEIISSVTSTADKQIENLKKTVAAFAGASAGVVSKAKGLSIGVLDGFLAGLNIFGKNK